MSKIDPAIIKIWISLAKSDLKSAKILYTHKQHRASYYFFQQASEKGAKAMALHFGMATEKTFLEIRHDILQMFKKYAEKELSKTESIIQELESVPPGEHSISKILELKKQRDSLEKGLKEFDAYKMQDFINISARDLDEMLAEPGKSVYANLVLPKTYNKTAKFMVDRFFKKLEKRDPLNWEVTKKYLDPLIKDQEGMAMAYEVVAKILNFLSGLLYSFIVFSTCAVVTHNHNHISRYPHKGVSPIKIYRRRLPIVKKQSEFMRLLEKALNRFPLEDLSN